MHSSYPDDQYNRYWAPFADANPAVESHSSISPDDFWNQPPAKALKAGVTTSRGKNLTVRWPPAELPAATYYVALYFQDPRTASAYSWRVFDVAVNGQPFFRGLNASAAGVMVYSNMMQLSGKTEILLTPNATSPVGPLINAGEIYQIVPLGGKTATRDGMVRMHFQIIQVKLTSGLGHQNKPLALCYPVLQSLPWVILQGASRTHLRTGLETLACRRSSHGLGLYAPQDHPCASCHCKYSSGYTDDTLSNPIGCQWCAFWGVKFGQCICVLLSVLWKNGITIQ